MQPCSEGLVQEEERERVRNCYKEANLIFWFAPNYQTLAKTKLHISNTYTTLTATAATPGTWGQAY